MFQHFLCHLIDCSLFPPFYFWLFQFLGEVASLRSCIVLFLNHSQSNVYVCMCVCVCIDGYTLFVCWFFFMSLYFRFVFLCVFSIVLYVGFIYFFVFFSHIWHFVQFQAELHVLKIVKQETACDTLILSRMHKKL